jgi:hypothetical protein
MSDSDTAVAPEAEGTTEETQEATTEQTTEVPEWLSKKYMTPERSLEEAIQEQAKAHRELEKKFGSFTGAPEEYEVTVSEELKERGFEVDDNDVLLDEAKVFAKEIGMSQDGFNRMVEMWAKTEFAKADLENERISNEMKALGKNAEARVKNLADWASANLPPDLIEGFQQAGITAGAIQAMEQMIAMTRNAPATPSGAQGAPGATAEEVRKMQFEKDEHGNRRIQTDPDFRARYNKLRDQVYGTEPHRKMVG